jgi:hypothetical protein
MNDPAMDRRVINVDATLGHHLLPIAQVLISDPTSTLCV